MNNKILICTNTFFQLIVAIQLKITRFSKDDVDVIITAHSENSKNVAARLRELNLFRTVFYVEYNDNHDAGSGWKKYIMYGLGRINPGKTLSKYVLLNDDYNVFLFNNANFLTFLIWHVYKPYIHCYQFEEGFSTYTKPFLNKKRLHRLLITAIYGNLESSVEGLYLFHPELFHRSVRYPLIKIASMNKKDESLKNILNYIFDYSPFQKKYTEKYIFLGESFYASNIKIDDAELAQEISEVIGFDNLIVKTHPRCPGYFKNKGLKICDVSKIPWEVILLNEDFSDKVLLTISSGSIFASTLYFNERVQTYLLFNCVKQKSPMLDEAFFRYIADLSAGEDSFIIPCNKQELLKELDSQISV